MHENTIYYSQCWEDPRVLLKALAIKSDDLVLSVTSGGDNALAILCEGASKVVSIDINPAQNFLLELKYKSSLALSYKEYLEFMGVRNSKSRIDLYRMIEPMLSEQAKRYWSNHIEFISTGIIHCGKFDKYIRFFARRIISLIHSKSVVQKFLSSETADEQWKYYNEVWNSRLWRFVLGIATKRQFLMKARHRDMFAQAGKVSTSEEYLRRLEKIFS